MTSSKNTIKCNKIKYKQSKKQKNGKNNQTNATNDHDDEKLVITEPRTIEAENENDERNKVTKAN